ncbi:MAG: GNAT family N-acetyltransferase [Clostridiaceae bacterium]
MNIVHTPLIHVIRSFNRFYTNVLGLLDQHLLDSKFSLAEVRVLYDIEHTENCTSKNLIKALRIDAGYLSRIIKRFEKNNLLYKVQSQEDGRIQYLYLTDEGKNTLFKLDCQSNNQISQLINSIPKQDQLAVVESMNIIENVFSKRTINTDRDIIIRNDLKPGDIGYLVHMHGWIYAKECGYNHMFEGYVCKTFYNFFENYNPEKDRLWLAESNGKIIGAIAIVGHSDVKAQLRWFILHPLYRGIGLGSKLLNEALNYCKDKHYNHIFLETTTDQKAAIKMYTAVGFSKVSENKSEMWGRTLVEQTYELHLP